MIQRCYFFVKPYESCEKFRTNYQHEIIALAEGFLELGLQVAGNVDYWPFLEQSQPLIPQKDIDAFAPDLVIVSGMFFSALQDSKTKELIKSLIGQGTKVVATDLHDGCLTPSFGPSYRQFTLVLKAHASRHFSLPENVVPWAFGLTQRIIDATSSQPPFEERIHQLLWNFRIPQGLRKVATTEVEPVLEKHIPLQKASEPLQPNAKDQTGPDINCHSGGRHNPGYFYNLSHSVASACFGGHFSTRFYQNDFFNRTLRRLNNRLPIVKPTLLYQWDSYRFWESLAAGCLVLHADLEEEGCLFPVPIESMKQYIGWSLKSPDSNAQVLELFASKSSQLEEIASAGRQWALEHYAPKPVALRLLRQLV